MGCYHYEQKAAAARNKIKKLEEERAKYVEAQKSVNEAIRAIGCYTNYLGAVDAAMSSVIVNGEPFDKGESKTHQTNLTNDAKTLENLNTEMNQALKEIADEIMSQERIIDNEYTCASCAAIESRTRSK